LIVAFIERFADQDQTRGAQDLNIPPTLPEARRGARSVETFYVVKPEILCHLL